jgi:uncharacterized protein
MNEQIKSGSRDLHTDECIRTYTGRYINVFDPQPDCISIIDIAHALSHQCRFGGHVPYFYSVAQHSMAVAACCSVKNKLAGLLHDATEAYLCDIPKPIKRHLPDYKKVEELLMRAIALRYGFQYPFHDEIKMYDKIILEKEHNELIINRIPSKISAAEVKERFIESFYQYQYVNTYQQITESPN